MIRGLPKDEINLLPDEHRDARLRRIMLKRVGGLLHRCIFILLITLTAFTVVYFVEIAKQRSRSSLLAAEIREGEDVSDEIRQANDLIRSVYDFSGSVDPWTVHVVDVLEGAPSTITITEFSVSAGTTALEVRGVARSRAAIVDFEKTLSELAWVERVEAPLKNFATGVESEFSFTVYRQGAKKSDVGGLQ